MKNFIKAGSSGMDDLTLGAEALEIATSIAGIGIYSWDIPEDRIIYSSEYTSILGYTAEDIGETISIRKWTELSHPDDLPIAMAALRDHFSGKSKTYKCEMRMLHKNGRYVWTKALGKTIEWTENGKPKKFIGAHQNINEQKTNYEKLEELLLLQETSNQLLEEKIRAKAENILRQDKILWTINDISRNLLAVADYDTFDRILLDCLKQYCEADGISRISLWRNSVRDAKLYCSLMYDWNNQTQTSYVPEKEGLSDAGNTSQNSSRNVLYEKQLPSFLRMFDTKTCLNARIEDLLPVEQADPELQNIRSILAIPLFIGGTPWGFIAIDNCFKEEIFSEVQERMLTIFGSLLAYSIQKKEATETVRELNMLNSLMLDSLPIGSNIWDKNMRNITCNQEIVRIFGFKDKQDFIDNFYKIQPEFQPNGRPSMAYAEEIINKTFEEGYFKTEWMSHSLSGEPIPVELTLSRLQYGNTHVVLGYIKDLREERAMIAEIHRKDEMLENVNKIAEKLLSHNDGTAFDSIVDECLQIIGESTGQSRVYIWKDIPDDGKGVCCAQIYEWVAGVRSVQNIPDLELIPYAMLPSFLRALEEGNCLNSFIDDLSDTEKTILKPQGIKTILIAPIKINGKNWGFIGIDNCREEALFSELEETMLLMSGSLLASAVEKRDRDLLLKESDEYSRMLLEANPVTCNLWDENLRMTYCNQATLNLFGVQSFKEFSEKFSQLSPEFQPNGAHSETQIKKVLKQGFEKGYVTFEWMHVKTNGTPMPSKVTLVRLKYQGKYWVAAYILDLTETRESEALIQTLFDASPLMNILCDKEQQLIFCNQTAAQIFGLSDKSDYLNKYREFFPRLQPGGATSFDFINRKLADTFKTGRSTFDLLYQKSDGTPIPTEVHLVRIQYRGDFAVAGYIRDLREEQAMLAEIHKNEKELKIARDEAIAQSKAKSNFLAKMSHEIRTPMNAILGMAELVLRENIPPQVKGNVISIKQAGENLLSIINDVLDFSKIESGKFEIIETSYQLSSLVNDVTSIIRMRIIDKPVLFVTNIDPTLPNRLIGDEIRMRQILLNILNNAVKYTKEGYISFNISGEVKGTSVLFVFEISDTGIGIKSEDMDRLFSEFVQADKLKNHGVEGTGLGLAITKNLCEAMGGNIGVSSEYGRGSAFTITVPQQIESVEPFATVQNPEAHNILVYEPREIYANSIIRSIATLGVSCTSVTTQSDFFEKLKSDAFTFVFISSFLFETTQRTVTKLKLSCTLVLLAEYGEAAAAENCRTIAMPAHAISIANILNNDDDSVAYSETDSNYVRFIAPDCSVLIVDDIVTNLKVAEGLLLPYEFSIDTCESGFDAVKMAEKREYDIIFMDHMMPDMNGVEATAAIRGMETSGRKAVTIVALTANAVLGMKEYFLANGFNDYLAKPIDTKKLGELLEKWIPKEKKRPFKLPARQNAEPVFEIDGIDVRAGIALTGGTTDNYLKILKNFYSESAEKIGSIRQFSADKNLKQYGILVHALKSALGSIGAKELSACAKSLELAANKEDTEFINENTENFLIRFEYLRKNISLVISKEAVAVKTENTREAHDRLPDALTRLKRELQAMNVSAADKLLNELAGFPVSKKVKTALERIEQMVLLSDYEEAVTEIDDLLTKNQQ